MCCFFIENRTPKAYAVKQAFAEADNISDKIKNAPSGFLFCHLVLCFLIFLVCLICSWEKFAPYIGMCFTVQKVCKVMIIGV